MVHSIMVIEVQYMPVQAAVKILQKLNDEHDVQFINGPKVDRALMGNPMQRRNAPSHQPP
jgi:hypothetical protein